MRITQPAKTSVSLATLAKSRVRDGLAAEPARATRRASAERLIDKTAEAAAQALQPHVVAAQAVGDSGPQQQGLLLRRQGVGLLPAVAQHLFHQLTDLAPLVGADLEVMRRDEIRLRGEHNVENVLSAVAVAGLLGVSEEAAARAIRVFTGVPHRLEPIATIEGVTWINDSIATAPERTLAGMHAFTEPLVLLLGGRDKNLPTRVLGEEAVRRCRAVITFGEASDLYASAIRDAEGSERVTLRQVADVDAAVAAAAELAHSGDVVLFSPAGTSFDAFRNFEARGRAFRDAVLALEGTR